MPEDVRRLVEDCVRSPTELETVLFLRERRDVSWTAPRLAEAIGVDEQSAGRLLFDLMSRGFLLLTDYTPITYRYRPKSAEFGATVDRLAQLHTERPVLIARLVAARPSESLRLFSDAFRLRREED